MLAHLKMLESRPEDALGSLVETEETVENVETIETVETQETQHNFVTIG